MMRTGQPFGDTRTPSQKELSGYPLIFGYLGVVVMLAGVIVLLPLLVLPFYPREADQARYFIIPGVLAILAGYLMGIVLKGREKGRLEKNQELLIVLAAWIIAIVICALPFVLTGKYSFTQAVFEAASGFSTTGLSVVDVASTPHIFLIHRTVMLFFGGVGLVLVMTSVFSARTDVNAGTGREPYGMRLYSAEGHSDRLLPSLIESARLIIGIYSGYIIGGTLLYVMLGMSAFDAFNHSVAALSTGGFSTRRESIGFYSSSAIELVTMVLMLLGCTNFFVHLLLLKGRWKAVLHHCETRLMLALIGVFTPIFVVLLAGGIYNNIPETIQTALFQIISAFSTTGFQTVPEFLSWSPALKLLMVVLMLIGGGAGSTAGGMKLYRVSLAGRELVWKLREELHPKKLIQPRSMWRYGKKETVAGQEIGQVNVFLMLYVLLFFLGTFIFTLFGYSVEDSMFEFSSALSTVGLSVGITSYDAHPVILWTAAAGMFLGRLELFLVFTALARLAADAKETGRKIVRKGGKRL